jgi:molecular chaperone GrpE
LSENEAAAEEALPSADAPGDERAESPGTGGVQSGPESEDIDALRQQAEDNWNRYLRSVAELENLRKRNAREVEQARRYGIEKFANGILPVRDSLEAGLKAAREADPAGLEIASLLEGDEATLRLLNQALAAVGITEIDPEGEPFDPERHEAISMLPSPTAEPNSVIVVVQKGFALHDRVVRPARVVVASAPADPQGDSGA